MMMSDRGGAKAMAMDNSGSAHSYAHNSFMQNHNFHAIIKPSLEKAIAHLMPPPPPPSKRLSLAVADLGCSHGRNTIDCALFILQSLQRFSHHNEEAQRGIEVQYFFSDLPSNDFNALFLALQPHLLQHNSSTLTHLYVAGVPGSFYGRLFSSASLDFVICSYSLHWLSQAPPSIIDRSSSSWNGQHAWIYKATKDVLHAYTTQAKNDIKSFLISRASELKSGGILFLSMAGSSSMPNQFPLGYYDTVWEVFDLAWLETIEEGIITLEEMEMFNLPMFFLNQEQLKSVVVEVSDFKILDMGTTKDMSKQGTQTSQQWLAFMLSVIKPTVDSYLGTYKSNELFDKVKDIVLHRNKSFSTYSDHNLVVASLQRL